MVRIAGDLWNTGTDIGELDQSLLEKNNLDQKRQNIIC